MTWIVVKIIIALSVFVNAIKIEYYLAWALDVRRYLS